MKLSPYTYINANLSSDRGITAAKLVEMVSTFAHAQGISRVDLSNSPITMSSSSRGGFGGYGFGGGRGDRVDDDTTGVLALLHGMQASQTVGELALSNCGIGPASLSILAPIVTCVALRRLDVSKNKIGVAGAKALVSMLPRSNIATLVFGPKATMLRLQVIDATLALQPEPQATVSTCVTVDFSKQELGPAELIIIAWWLSPESAAGLEVVDMSGNPISGAGKQYSNSKTWDKDIDADLVGVTALSKALPGSRIKALTLSECGLGPKSIATACR